MSILEKMFFEEVDSTIGIRARILLARPLLKVYLEIHDTCAI